MHAKKDLTPGGRLLAALLAIVQIAYSFLAFWDLANRPASEVRGPKPAWIPVILVNWIGPTVYFYAHRHR